MKRWQREALFVLVLLASGLMGLVLRPRSETFTTPQPAVIMEVLDPSLADYAPLWRDEIGRRFTHAVGVLVHGGDFVEGQWVVGSSYDYGQHVTPVATIVKHYQRLYPDRTIVLLACNTGHLRLGIPGVYYATSPVWCVPDRALTDMTEAHAKATLYDGEGEDADDPAPPPTTKPSPLFPFLPFVITREPPKTRWQEDPDAAGNIFEFVAD
jgi:hypothetical protein